MTETELTPTTPEGDNSAKVGLLQTQPKWLLASIGGVGLLVVLLAAGVIWMLVTGRGIGEIPGIEVNQPPVFSYSITELQRPLGLAIDNERGRMYVVESEGSRYVAVLDAEGKVIGSLDPSNTEGIHSPAYVAVDPANGNVYVSDRGSGKLYIYDAQGELIGDLHPKGVKNWGPLAVAVGENSVVYVSDSNAVPQQIWALQADGTVIAEFGALEKLSFVNGLTLQSDGSLLVSDSGNGRMLAYNTDGTLRGNIARGDSPSPIGLPRGMAVSDKGRLYIVDTMADIVRVYKWDDAGIPVYSTEFGEPGNLDGQFIFPNSVAIDAEGRIFVTDRENDRVQVWVNR